MFFVSKKDVLWSYFAQFFSIASGIITLPAILYFLKAEEIGFNYLLITISSLVTLFDFGFAPQIARNITYIYSGSQELISEGVRPIEGNATINYPLLATMIATVTYLYKRIALIAMLVMLSIGTVYIYYITKGFTNVDNSVLIWIVFSVSVCLNIYYSYYISLLTGSGQITESRKAIVYSKFSLIILTVFFLYFGTGLFGVVIANVISSLVNRVICSKYFFRKDLKNQLENKAVDRKAVKECFKTLWFNSKKLGLINIAGSSLNYLALFIIGLYLNLDVIASYGLMIQLGGILSVMAMTLFTIYLPKMGFNFTHGDLTKLKSEISVTLFVFYVMFIMGGIVIILFGDPILLLLKSKIKLPESWVLIMFFFFSFFEKNQSLFSQILLLENKVPFMLASLVTGSVSLILIYGSLLLDFGLIGVVLSQGIPTLLYSAWKWPMLVMQRFNICFFSDIVIGGFKESKRLIFG